MDTFTKQYYIEDYMCDKKCRILPSYLLRIAQSISTLHCENMGVYDKLEQLGHRFLLTKQQCTVYGAISAREVLTVKSYPTTPTLGMYPRITEFVNSRGNTIAKVDARWFLFDTVNRKPLRKLNDNITYNAIDIGKLPPISIPRIDAPIVHNRDVRYTDIDSNGHVNNAVYLDYLSDILGDEQITSFSITYRKEITSDTVQLHGCYIDNSRYYLAGYCNNEKHFEIIATIGN